MKQILAAVDFSDYTDGVVEHAAALAGAFDAKLTLLHVAAPDPDFVGYAAGPDSVRWGHARQLRTAQRRLRKLADDLRERGLAATALLVEGPTAQKILEDAESLAADALVLGSRGHGAIARTLLGSVSQAVLHGAKTPVVVVPPAAAR